MQRSRSTVPTRPSGPRRPISRSIVRSGSSFSSKSRQSSEHADHASGNWSVHEIRCLGGHPARRGPIASPVVGGIGRTKNCAAPDHNVCTDRRRIRQDSRQDRTTGTSTRRCFASTVARHPRHELGDRGVRHLYPRTARIRDRSPNRISIRAATEEMDDHVPESVVRGQRFFFDRPDLGDLDCVRAASRRARLVPSAPLFAAAAEPPERRTSAFPSSSGPE